MQRLARRISDPRRGRQRERAVKGGEEPGGEWTRCQSAFGPEICLARSHQAAR